MENHGSLLFLSMSRAYSALPPRGRGYSTADWRPTLGRGGQRGGDARKGNPVGAGKLK